MPKSAIFTGYQIPVKGYKELVHSIPVAKDWLDVNAPDNFSLNFAAYGYWKRRLSPEQQRIVPRIKYRYVSEEASKSRIEPIEERISHILFIVRWVDYKGKEQLEDEAHPDWKKIHEETELNKARLLNFL
ncbi:hypothetical protein AX16_006683 [Volvariella volvacea WC 439]|nr:hypothetical protein AX16_006683 [Volvariella volvacea WC 439]